MIGCGHVQEALCRDTAIVSRQGGETGAHDRRAAAPTTRPHAGATRQGPVTIDDLCRDRPFKYAMSRQRGPVAKKKNPIF